MRTLIILICSVALLGAGGFFGYKHFTDEKAPTADQWKTQTITRGELVHEVNATGTIEPILTISVGTQVNGPIKKLYVDYNDEVKEGQLIAQIDPITYQAAVSQNEAQLASNKANVEQIEVKLALAEKELVRSAKLAEKQMVSQSAYDTTLAERDTLTASLKIAKASVAQSEASLLLARANLGYTTICSPVDGVVIQRNVDEGQTVVSSMSAQELFSIGTDLSHIQINASISESDVGVIKSGQTVTFKVDAYRTTFTGEVVQVRMASTTVQNVVTFPVIIRAPNPGKTLFPGMTANLYIETGRLKDVIKVPLAALRYTPESETGEGKPFFRPGSGVWIVGNDNKPMRVDIKQLLSDGTYAAVESEEPLENKAVILGVNMQKASKDKQTENPFAFKPPGSKSGGAPKR